MKRVLQVVSNNVIVEVNMSITGIGGKITVSPNVELGDDVNITGELNVMGKVQVEGTIGDVDNEISEIYVSSVNIGSVIVSEETGELAVSEKINIAGQSGSVITGTGIANRFTVYDDVNEAGVADSIIWDATKAQIGIGSI